MAEGATHVGICDNIGKSAFTLAEVLITLAIIGVVAAMTIPTLIAHFEKKSRATVIKKTYAELVNIVQFSKIDNGEIAVWNFPTDYSLEQVKTYADKYIMHYYKNTNPCDGLCDSDYIIKSLSGNDYALNGRELYQIKMSNGSYLTFYTTQKYLADTPGQVMLLLDTNASKGPNKMGKDIFSIGALYSGDNGAFYLMGVQISDRAALLDESSIRNCNENVGNGERCTHLLRLDGWEFKDDYPW